MARGQTYHPLLPHGTSPVAPSTGFTLPQSYTYTDHTHIPLRRVQFPRVPRCTAATFGHEPRMEWCRPARRFSHSGWNQVLGLQAARMQSYAMAWLTDLRRKLRFASPGHGSNGKWLLKAIRPSSIPKLHDAAPKVRLLIFLPCTSENNE